ncbi:DUF6098 family protein [Nonomuraea sp. NPDC050536]|uniref:DUF6098 family protein n=1 Tax=Nonomuraea sp. NPDC050536 TaxID=3364366 RepID=UPI0037C873E6
MAASQHRMRTLRSLDELADLVKARPGLHLRYSQGPRHDTGRASSDYESGLELPGLSVTVLDPERWWTRPCEDWLARQVCKYADLGEGPDGRRPWVLTGRVVARGPDHEPLMVDVLPVAWLDEQVVRQARQRYHERFEVGRDSTS